jgi:hypothetical protein
MVLYSSVFRLCFVKKRSKVDTVAADASGHIKQVAGYVTKPLYLPFHLQDSYSHVYPVFGNMHRNSHPINPFHAARTNEVTCLHVVDTRFV